MKQYLNLLNYILATGETHENRTGMNAISTFGYQMKIDLREGFPLLTTKKMFHRGIMTELEWFLRGRTDNQWLNERNVHIWDEWATEEQCARFGRAKGDLGPVYGKLWRDFYGVDQIKNLVLDLINNPNSRRLIVTGWDPLTCNLVALPPCHTLWQCKVTNGFLDLQLYQRSADAFLGVPFNIASYAALTHILAGVSGLKPRYFIHTFGDLHIYKNHLDQVHTQLSREPFPLPKLLLSSTSLTDLNYEIVDYKYHPAIKGDIAV